MFLLCKLINVVSWFLLFCVYFYYFLRIMISRLKFSRDFDIQETRLCFENVRKTDKKLSDVWRRYMQLLPMYVDWNKMHFFSYTVELVKQQVLCNTTRRTSFGYVNIFNQILFIVILDAKISQI